ncbi:Mitogen-Activated Protein Kinase Kinase Kinase 8 [Marasmius crinis-equi]|uniref:Mitogen-Activated Protein Kinase Kinase Kinase 8 n=1 Tax=Marasmius crinis-equi TaxID=585013 RepID=A0ABR3FKZ8_9AGAR
MTRHDTGASTGYSPRSTSGHPTLSSPYATFPTSRTTRNNHASLSPTPPLSSRSPLGSRYSRCIPLPSQTRAPHVDLHPLLQCHPRDMAVPPLNWDLSRPRFAVERLLRRRSGHTLGPYLRELATNPALPSMTLIHPRLAWPITVHSSGGDEGVTVADVLLAISDALREKDHDGWGGIRGVEKLQYLEGKRTLVGLTKRGPDSEVWEMNTE